MRPKKREDEPKSVNIHLTVNEKLLEEIDIFAEKHYMTRSAMITYACNQVISAEKTITLLQSMNETLQTMFKAIEANPDCGVSEEEIKELEKMEFALDMISGEYLKKNPDLLG